MPESAKQTIAFDFDLLPTCSANDCTGLIAAAPTTEEEWAAYHDIYDFGLPQIDRKRLAQENDG